jgi:hypothetical protein
VVGIAVTIAAFLAWLVVRQQYRRHLPARSIIVTPRKSTLIAKDGAVRSVQSARLTLSPADLDRLWSPANLENLGRTYWRFLTRVTLGLIRVRYGESDRSVVLLARPLTLLRFDPPQYVLEPDHGRLTWRIRDGLLVARSGRGSGWLSLDVRRMPAPSEPGSPVELSIEVEVANFYPAIAVGISTPTYEATQAFVHVLVTHAFLRSLATLELKESKIRRFAAEQEGAEDDLAQAPPRDEGTHAPPRDRPPRDRGEHALPRDRGTHAPPARRT